MCDDHALDRLDVRDVPRRSVLGGAMAGLIVGPALPAAVVAQRATPVAGAVDLFSGLDMAGLTPVLRADHNHASSSEGPASLLSHFTQAAANGISLLTITEHVQRRNHDSLFPRSCVFTNTPKWQWAPVSTGAGGAHSDTTVRLTGADAAHALGNAKALRLTASRGNVVGTHGLRVSQTLNSRLEGNVVGRKVLVPCRFLVRTGQSYLQLELTFSRHRDLLGATDSTSGRLVIRFMIGDRQGIEVTSDRLAHVYLQAPPVGQWTTDPLVLDLETSLRQCWPDLRAEDNSLTGLSVSASCLGGAVDVTVPYLGLPREVVGDAAVASYHDRLRQVGNDFPAITAMPGVEVSWKDSPNHIVCYGTDELDGLVLAPSPDPTLMVEAIHSGGGVASLAHLFGTKSGVASDDRVLKVARRLAAQNLHGCETLEVGYVLRGGMDLDRHLQAARLLWRYGFVYTAVGVGDSHGAVDWARGENGNNFVNQMWSNGAGNAAQLYAMRAGTVSVIKLGEFRGGLAVSLDGAPMGSVTRNSTPSDRVLSIIATEVPAGGRVEVIRGVVDGSLALGGVTTQATFTAAQLASGTVDLTVPGDVSSYYQVVIRAESGTIVAFSNPVWDLLGRLPNGRTISGPRRFGGV